MVPTPPTGGGLAMEAVTVGMPPFTLLGGVYTTRVGTATVETGVVAADSPTFEGGTGMTTDTTLPPLLDGLVGTLVDKLLKTVDDTDTGGGAGTATGGTFELPSVEFKRLIPPGPNENAALEVEDWEIMVRL